MGASGALSSFGQEVKQTDKDWFTEIVNNQALYRGNNVLDAANYIYLKIYEKYVHQVPSLDYFNVEQDNIERTSKTSQKENGPTILQEAKKPDDIIKIKYYRLC